MIPSWVADLLQNARGGAKRDLLRVDDRAYPVKLDQYVIVRKN